MFLISRNQVICVNFVGLGHPGETEWVNVFFSSIWNYSVVVLLIMKRSLISQRYLRISLNDPRYSIVAMRILSQYMPPISIPMTWNHNGLIICVRDIDTYFSKIELHNLLVQKKMQGSLVVSFVVLSELSYNCLFFFLGVMYLLSFCTLLCPKNDNFNQLCKALWCFPIMSICHVVCIHVTCLHM